MGTHKGDAHGGLFSWLKFLLRKEKSLSQQTAVSQPGSPRASSRKRVAAEEQQAPALAPPLIVREAKAPVAPLPPLQGANSHLRTQTWVTDAAAGQGPALATRSAHQAAAAAGGGGGAGGEGACDVVQVDRLDSFRGPEAPPSTSPSAWAGGGGGGGGAQPPAKRFTLLSGPLTQADNVNDGGGLVKGRPSGGHTAVEELNPQGTQDSFTSLAPPPTAQRAASRPQPQITTPCQRQSQHQWHQQQQQQPQGCRVASILADDLTPTAATGDSRNPASHCFPRSADNIPRGFDAATGATGAGDWASGVHHPLERRPLRPCVGSMSGTADGMGPEAEEVAGLWEPPDKLPGSPRRSPGSGPRPLSALRNPAPFPSAGHSRSRLGAAAAAGSQGGGAAAATAATTTTTTTTTTTSTDTTSNHTSKDSSDVTTRVVPPADGRSGGGGGDVETTKRTRSMQEQSQRKITQEREVEDVRSEAAAPGAPGQQRPRHGHAGPAAEDELGGGDGSNRWRRRERERRDESSSRRLNETRTEETETCPQALGDLAGASRRCSTKTVTTTHREEEEVEERRVEEETVTEGGGPAAAAGQEHDGERDRERLGDGPPGVSSRYSRTSQVSSQHTTWRIKTTTSRTQLQQQQNQQHPYRQPAPPATPPQPPPPATAAWSGAAAAGAAAGSRPPGNMHTTGMGIGGTYEDARACSGGRVVPPVAQQQQQQQQQQPREYLRQHTLTEQDLASLSGSQPYLGLESRTDILGRFLDDVDDGVIESGAGGGSRMGSGKLHPPPMTPGARSAASNAAPVRPFHLRYEDGGGGGSATGTASRLCNGTGAGAGADDVDAQGYGDRPASRPGRRVYSPSWGPQEQQYLYQQRGGGPLPLQHPQQQQQHRDFQQSLSSSTQRQQETTTTTHRTVEVHSSTVTTGQQCTRQQQQQQQQQQITSTVTRVSQVQQAGSSTVQQQTREESHRQQRNQQATTTTTTTCANACGAASTVSAGATDNVLREAIKRLSGTGVGGGAGGGGGEDNTEDEDEGTWDAAGAGRKSRKQRRVRIAPTWQNPGGSGGGGGGVGESVKSKDGGGFPADGGYAVDTSWDAYAHTPYGAGGGGGKSFISRSGKSHSTRVSPPRTAGGRSHSGGVNDGFGSGGGGSRGWDPTDGDLYDKYDTSSRALAAQAQLMRSSRPRNPGASVAALSVAAASALNPLTWQSAISPTAANNSTGFSVHGSSGHGAAGCGDGGGGLDAFETGGSNGMQAGQQQLQQPQQSKQHLAASGPSQTSRRHQSSPGNTDIPGLPALLRNQRRNDPDAAGGGVDGAGAGFGGGGGGGGDRTSNGGGYSRGVTGRANLTLSAELAELSAGLAGMTIGGGGGGRRLRDPGIPHA